MSTHSPSPDSLLWAGPTLVLDASTATIHAGILSDRRWIALASNSGDALETIFAAVEGILKASQLELPKIQAVALGIGPGSILGLRLSLMALQTWLQLPSLKHWKLFQFSGLSMHAQLHAHAFPSEHFHLVTDFRRGNWHHLEVNNGQVGELDILRDEELSTLSDKIRYIPTGRGGNSLPDRIIVEPFSIAALPDCFPTSWAAEVKLPELYLPTPPAFKPWTAQRHR